MSKKKKFEPNKMTPQEELRFEIAKEIGYADKIISGGWGALTSKESGKIGGILSQKKRKEKKQ